MTVHMHKVKSSAIAEIGHDPETNTLHVKFHSGPADKVHTYPNFEVSHFNELKGAKSVGSHLHKLRKELCPDH